MKAHDLVASLFLVACSLDGLAAQSLGEVAQRTAERRSPVTAGKRYTNADLAPTDFVPPPAARPDASTPSVTDVGGNAAGESKAGTPNTGALEPPVNVREPPDEQSWRRRAREIRNRLAKANAAVVATRSRLEDLDAVPGSPATVQERRVTAAAFARLLADAGFLRAELTQFETRARADKIPEDWTR
jgi:hypothetical protein